ncbi:MAG: zinc ribbon domain-containing protein [Coprobacillus sp.]
MYCHRCGKEIGETKFCPYCGTQQDVERSLQPAISPVRNDDESSVGFALLSFFVPVVGLVLYLVWNKEYPKKAKSCLKGFIANIVIYVCFICCVLSFCFGALVSYDGDSRYDYYYNDSYDESYDNDYYNDIFNTIIQPVNEE